MYGARLQTNARSKLLSTVILARVICNVNVFYLEINTFPTIHWADCQGVSQDCYQCDYFLIPALGLIMKF